VGTLGPLLNILFGRIIANQAFIRMPNLKPNNYVFKLFKRFIQLGVIVLSSTQKEVIEQTEARKQRAKMHWIQISNHESFVKYYNSTIDMAPAGKNYAKDVLGLEDVRFFRKLREACSSYLNITDLLEQKIERRAKKTGTDVKSVAESLLDDHEVKDASVGGTGTSVGKYVVLKGDGTDDKACGFEGKDSECPICCDAFDNPFLLPCKHVICQNCLISIIEAVKSDALLRKGVGSSHDLKCPLCNAKAKEGQLASVIWEDPAEAKKVIWESDYEKLLASIKDGDKKSVADITGLGMYNHPKLVYAINLIEQMFAESDAAEKEHETTQAAVVTYDEDMTVVT
jgi:hypothetical protein